MKKRYLLLGTHPERKLDKRITFEGSPDKTFQEGLITTLDLEAHEGTSEIGHVCFDLTMLHQDQKLPFESGQFDEIHAYEVLEHFGQQGDYNGFFDEFAEYRRVLKPGGYMCISVPMWDSPWAHGDPGHTRVLPAQAFTFLTKDAHDRQKRGEAASDYSANLGDNDWEIQGFQETEHQLFAVLKKPE